MLSMPEQSSEEVTSEPRAGALVTGDLGLVVLRALLENGVGYVVSSWLDRPTPIDAALADARRSVLERQGMMLRRLRSLSALEPLVMAPSGGVAGSTPRGAVVFAGRNGLRPSLEHFVGLRTPGAVVGFTFDADAARIDGALVVDPEPTAGGVLRAVEMAFTASAMCGRPALIVLRERALGMRGTVRMRGERSPVEIAVVDAAARANVTPAAAARAAGLIGAELAPDGSARNVLIVAGPVAGAARRALSIIAAESIAAAEAERSAGIALLRLDTPGLLPELSDAAGVLIAGAERVLVVGVRATHVAEEVRRRARDARVVVEDLDVGVVMGERVTDVLRAWLRDDANANRAPVIAASPLRGRTVPRRGERLHRSVRPTVAAGLTLAQGVIGVPGRTDVAYPTYATDTGVALSVVPAAVFLEHGVASAAPGTANGVFLITDAVGGVDAAAGAAGASIEYIDGGSPRAIGVAIGRACAGPRAAPHVIVITDTQRVAAPRRAVFGVDAELLATERLATAAVPPAAKVLVDMGSDTLAGPVELVLDHPDTHAELDSVRELSPATWDLRPRHGTMTRSARTAWQLRRRMVRAAGVDL